MAGLAFAGQDLLGRHFFALNADFEVCSGKSSVDFGIPRHLVRCQKFGANTYFFDLVSTHARSCGEHFCLGDLHLKRSTKKIH